MGWRPVLVSPTPQCLCAFPENVCDFAGGEHWFVGWWAVLEPRTYNNVVFVAGYSPFPGPCPFAWCCRPSHGPDSNVLPVGGKRTRREDAVRKFTGADGKVAIPRDVLAELNVGMPAGIKVLPSGKYIAKTYHDGKAGPAKSFDRFEDAKRWRAAKQAALAAGEAVDSRAAKNARRQPIQKFFEAFLRSKSQKSASYQDSIREDWRLYLKDWGPIEVGSVSGEDVESWVADFAASETRLGGTFSRSVVRRCVLVLKGVFAEAVHARAIASSPVDLSRLKALYPAVSTERPNPLSPEELDALVEATSPKFKLTVEIIARLGLRVGEAAELRVKDVRLRGRSPSGVDYSMKPIVRVERAYTEFEVRDGDGNPVRDASGKVKKTGVVGPPKYNSQRTIRLSPKTAEVLKKAVKGKRPDELVMVNSRGERLQRRGFGTVLEDAQARAGIVTASGQKITPHSLRDTAVTHWLASGMPPEQVAKQAGHKDTGVMWQRYSGLMTGDEDLSVARLAAFELASEAAITKAREERATERETKASKSPSKRAPVKKTAVKRTASRKSTGQRATAKKPPGKRSNPRKR